jgi:predicted pyridoxine 5'-phosphate oxidase superfamily flavin-nucleotide-binding protein
LGPEEQAFVAERDSFYLATVSSDGWPYVQHRGGPKGFLHALDEHTLAFADWKGNRQLISAGNIGEGGRVALIAVDYPRRERLKDQVDARLVRASDDPALAERLIPPGRKQAVERLMVVDVVGVDWNCPAYITPRYTMEKVEEMVRPMRERLEELTRSKKKSG